MAVRAPCRQRRTTTGPAPGTQRRRVMVDPPSRSVRRGMTVRAPPHRRRIMTYPSPLRRGRRVMIVRAPRRACRSRTGRAPRKGAGSATPRCGRAQRGMSATPQAPGHDAPPRRAPGHGRPRAAQLVPDHHWSHHAPMAPPGHAPARAGSRPGARRHVCAYRHRSLAGPREPAAPGPSIPYHRHSRQPHLPAIPPIRREPPRPVLPSSHLLAVPPHRREPPRPVLPRTHRPTLPLHHPSHASTHHGSNRGASLTTDGRQCASCHPGPDPPVTHHHGHGPPPPTPLPRPAPARLPKTYPCQGRGAARQPAAPALQGIDPHGDR